KASFTMGVFGITEGAIPFAAQDPIRVIPSIMAGSMVGAVIAMLGHVGDRVAHGGPIVAVLGAVDNVFMFFIAAIIGTIVTAIMVNLLKKDVAPAAVTPQGDAAANHASQIDTQEDTEAVTASAVTQTNMATNAACGQAETSDEMVITKLTDIINEDLI